MVYDYKGSYLQERFDAREECWEWHALFSCFNAWKYEFLTMAFRRRALAASSQQPEDGM
jgi:hypothetical protein